MILVILVIVGAVMGSFACCQAWRIYCKEQGRKKVRGKEIGQRSLCLSCGKQLRWYENIPVISWVVQKGKCRKCGAEIGKAEILSEILGAVMFVGLGVKVALEYANMSKMEGDGLVGVFGEISRQMFLKIDVPIFLVFFGIVFTLYLIIGVYDAKWGRIPVKAAVSLIILGVIYVVFGLITKAESGSFLDEGETVRQVFGVKAIGGDVLNVLASCGVLGGLYYVVYKISHEKLVGGGDWLVGMSVGLFLEDWWLSLLTLFVANLAALVFMLPRKKRKMCFGPFLVFGFWTVFVLSGILLRYKIVI